MNIEKMREEFEAWSAEHEFLGCCVVDRIGNGKYRDFDLQCAWGSWQASRESLEIELPYDSDGLNPDHSFVKGWRCGVDETKSAIEAAGLKVKP